MAAVPPIRAEAAARAPQEIRAAIHQAAATTGMPFDYLVAQAQQESGFKADARAAGSSAAGLYQFIESTWLRMVHDHGDKYGAGDAARAIAMTESGPRVADPAARARILALRDDPKLSAAMAAEYARGNHAQLAQTLGREVGATDLYLAHFLGPNGASRFLSTLRAEPGRAAADLMPEAAKANRAVFYDGDGRARSVHDIYARFAAKFDPGGAPVSPAANEPASPARAPFDFAGEGPLNRAVALEAVMRRTAAAALSGNVLSPTVIAALAALEIPHGESDTRKSAR